MCFRCYYSIFVAANNSEIVSVSKEKSIFRQRDRENEPNYYFC